MDLTGQEVTKLTDTKGLKVVGESIYLDPGVKLSTSNVLVIRVDSESSVVKLTAREISKFPPVVFPPKVITENVYEIDQPGKWWIVAKVNDRQKDLFGEAELFLELTGKGPKPPGPTPNPDNPAPIEGKGLRVLFVVESADATKLTSGQNQILYGSTRDFLNRHCAKGDDGTSPDWRILDPDTPFTDKSHRFAKALARPRASTPWVIISNGETGYEGPLPESPEEMALLLDQYVTTEKATVEKSVEMLSIPNCVWCKRFEMEELSKLSVQFKKISGHARLYPSFVIKAGDKQKILEGYQTADTILRELKLLEGSK